MFLPPRHGALSSHNSNNRPLFIPKHLSKTNSNNERATMIRILPIALTAALYGYSADAADCRPAFNGGTTYKAGDTVSATSTVVTTASCTCATSGCPTAAGQTSGCTSTTTTTEKHNYSCVSGANSAYCGMAGFEPAGQYSSMAWTKESAVCTVSVSSVFDSLPSYRINGCLTNLNLLFRSSRAPTWPPTRPPRPSGRPTPAARAPTSPARTTTRRRRSRWPWPGRPTSASTSASPPPTTSSEASPATSLALASTRRASGRSSGPAREPSRPRPAQTTRPSPTPAAAPTRGRPA